MKHTHLQELENLEQLDRVYLAANERRTKKLSLEFVHERMFEFLDLVYSYKFIFKSLYIEDEIIILSLNLSIKDSTRQISPHQKLGLTVSLRRKFNDMNCEYIVLKNLVIIKIYRNPESVKIKPRSMQKYFSSI